METKTQNKQTVKAVQKRTSAIQRSLRGLSILSLACGLITAGCTDRLLTVDPRTGIVTYQSKRFGNMEKFDKIIVSAGTNRIEIQGYTSDQVAIAEKVAGAVAKGVTEGMKP